MRRARSSTGGSETSSFRAAFIYLIKVESSIATSLDGVGAREGRNASSAVLANQTRMEIADDAKKRPMAKFVWRTRSPPLDIKAMAPLQG